MRLRRITMDTLKDLRQLFFWMATTFLIGSAMMAVLWGAFMALLALTGLSVDDLVVDLACCIIPVVAVLAVLAWGVRLGSKWSKDLPKDGF
jgi:hypothetical protein